MADDPIDPAPSGPGLSRRHTFSAFRHRNYRLFFFGQLVSVIGTAMQGTALPWLVYTTTQSALWLGIVAALTQLPSLFLWVFVGALVDRLP
ncbi:MAG TPA: MFS transporter, partial [Armatimonadota bacterium]|nr:MFS transporter [Armatimonadota bacterium]